MRRTTVIVLAAALSLGTLAIEGEEPSEVDTTHPCYDAETDTIVYEQQQVWFHEGESKAGNLAAAPWDTTEPSTSVQGGAGAGALTPGTSTLGDTAGTNQFATFAGTFTGCIDTVLFDIWSFDPTSRSGTSASAEPAAHNFGLSVTVDGQEVFTGGELEAVTEFANDGFGPNRNRFALDLGSTLQQYVDAYPDMQLDGEHAIEVSIRSWYANTGHAVYVWDTTEAPSGITFNGEVTDAYAALN